MTEEPERTPAAATAGQVKEILEAAEECASAVEQAAHEDARRIRAEAERDAERARDAPIRLAERAAELERRLDELAVGVREGIEALRTELAALRDPPAEAGDDVDEELIAEAEAVAAPEPDVRTPDERTPEGARLLALKMARDGATREDTARYLRENFDLGDPEALLDEAYSQANR